MFPEYILKVKRDAGVVIETMRIRKATMEDDGNYACEHSQQKASQIVHINSKFKSKIAFRAGVCGKFVYFAKFAEPGKFQTLPHTLI